MKFDVAVIGCGMAGIAAAKVLVAENLTCVVLEKSRGVGGRVATRRFDGIPVDHGAQFFTARTEVFLSKIGEWKDSGVCREWTSGFPVWQGGGLRYFPDGHPRYCCPLGMTALAKYEARDLEVMREQKVVSVEESGGSFLLRTEAGLEVESRAVLSTAPAPQTRALLGKWIEEQPLKSLETLVYSPCITAIFRVSAFVPDWVAVTVEGEDVQWIAADGSKRDYAGCHGPMVVQGSVAFSREHLEDDPLESSALLLQSAIKITQGGMAGAELLHAHRWRYAMVEDPLPGVFLELSRSRPLFFAGDAFLQANLESAWFSGQSAGKALASRLMAK